MSELDRRIEAHFDTDEPLPPDLLAAIARDEAARERHARLNDLDAALRNLPLEDPGPHLALRVRESIAMQRSRTTSPWADMAAVAAAAAALVAAWPWLRPLGSEMKGLWQGLADLAAGVEPITPPAFWSDALNAWSAAWPAALSAWPETAPATAGLVAACGLAVLAAVNGFEAVRSRRWTGRTGKGV